MSIKRVWRFSAAQLATALLVASPLASMAGTGAAGPGAPAPVGFLLFCQRQPASCATEPRIGAAEARAIGREAGRRLWREAFDVAATTSGGTGQETATAAPAAVAGPTALAWDRDLQARLEETNARVNGAIRPASDRETHGVPDYWSTPLEDGSRRGDCEDYALEKRLALLAQGVPGSALSLAVARLPSGEEHAVLLVSTTRGELMLDNRSAAVRPWTEANYDWRIRQVAGRPFDWIAAKPSG